MVATERPHGLSALNILAGRVGGLSSDRGPLVDIRIDCNGQAIVSRLTRQSTHALGLRLGQEVYAVIKTVSFDRGQHDARHTLRECDRPTAGRHAVGSDRDATQVARLC